MFTATLGDLVEVAEFTITGSDDGTPTYASGIVWTGPGRLDRADASTGSAPSGARTRKYSTLFLDAAIPIREQSHVFVTSNGSRDEWRVVSVIPVSGFSGTHHLEVKLDRVSEAP